VSEPYEPTWIMTKLTDEEVQTRLGRVPQDVLDRFVARIRFEALEEAAKHVETHSCVSTCCNAQPEPREAKALAHCIRALASRTSKG
jgi:hypothetical protein